MDPILEMRMWWSMAIIFCGICLPLIILMISHIWVPNSVKWYHLALACIVMVCTIVFARDVIPEKYDIKTERVYQCEWVDKIVPLYPMENKK